MINSARRLCFVEKLSMNARIKKQRLPFDLLLVVLLLLMSTVFRYVVLIFFCLFFILNCFTIHM